ncbi:WecB/TagA/CpsF family glycosyltransferase [Acidicapsa ligni]|uniref:WecB/TagA/CpsF family glycosyltransferase n=1 Tax=Acidicapsa ligni TaxID=542300 RepID=UPI0021E05594|nr:WecB/TagA/CpsF family glycosyltransferase [Acidicapsa ligni]
MNSVSRFQQILGVRFFVGDAQGAIEEVSQHGGLVVVPAAPALKNLAVDKGYREALLGADFAIADSAFMVLLWNLIDRNRIPKLSGLKYLRALVEEPDFQKGGSFWVMPTAASAQRNLRWLQEAGVQIASEDVYLAPLYGHVISDEELLERLEERQPKHIVLGIGGGTQERLGLYLKQNLSYRPAIHCIGAAIAFLSGDQVRIPVWADTLGLGWLWRTVADPKRFFPRYWDARHLAPLLLKYRDRLPITTA